jgi:hypothetical protein
VVKQSLYYQQQQDAGLNSDNQEDGGDDEDGDGQSRETSLMGAIPIGEAIHGEYMCLSD